MNKKPRSEAELRKVSIRLMIVVIFIVYLITPTGRQTFMNVANAITSLFIHHTK